MDRVERADQRLFNLKKPGLRKFSRGYLENEDVLIVCAGFEDRAIETLRRWDLSSGVVVLISYRPDVEENKVDEARSVCSKQNVRVVEYMFDRYDPSGFCEQIFKSLDPYKGRVYLDISGMSRILIVQLMVGIVEAFGHFERLSILYSEALKYPPSSEEYDRIKEKQKSIYDRLFLSEGVYDVSVLPELSTYSLFGQPLHLIAFPSFNRSQLTALCGELQPSALTLVHGVPPDPENKWRLAAIKELNSLESINPVKEFSTSTLDYRDTLDRLLELYDHYSVLSRCAISPTGSKMQAVAVGILRAVLSDIQVIYPTPRTFIGRTEYTIGVGRSYRVDLDTLDA